MKGIDRQRETGGIFCTEIQPSESVPHFKPVLECGKRGERKRITSGSGTGGGEIPDPLPKVRQDGGSGESGPEKIYLL